MTPVYATRTGPHARSFVLDTLPALDDEKERHEFPT